jgi:transcription termination factor Rho
VVRDRFLSEHLTQFSIEKFNLAERQSTISTRIIDLFSLPSGKRDSVVAIVAQPKRAKNNVVKEIANAIAAGNQLTPGLSLLAINR